NTIAIVSDGSRVLGLGDIGPEAALPVMEGKALLFKYLGGVDAIPICLNTKDQDEIIKTALLIQPAFGGINLEDIAQPKCFHILEILKKKAYIPVFHDDQQGSATVTLAGIINALNIVGKTLDKVKIAMIGAGASNITLARIITKAGADFKNIIMVDSKGILHSKRTDLREKFPQKWELAQKTNAKNIQGGIDRAMKGVDIVIAFSRPRPDIIKPQWVRSMAKENIVFACSNPVPEIWPWDARSAGVRIIATGRSDFSNQVNNSLGFPAIFRGALDVRAKTITDEMCIAAAYALAKYAQDKGLSEDYIIPSMDEWEMYPKVAAAVGMKAIEQGIASVKMSYNKLYKLASDTIRSSRDQIHALMKQNLIKVKK
ncbi:NADP-dependent malic enzyme, partial [Patescibacteria group bacterium AH-259-L07]|nr:NADP-dependent malic enzyme [Patescibacteria group bacterium AH-259-L07]